MNVLLINPSYLPSYGGAKAAIVQPIFPTLGLATIAASALEGGHHVEILDLCWRPYDFEAIRDHILKVKPDLVGLSATTPLMSQVRDISVLVKDIDPAILMVAGGPHPTALPEQTLRESMLDVVAIGEGDVTFRELCDGLPLADIKGIAWRDGEEIRTNPDRPPIEDLDRLPLPAWELFNADDYSQISRLYAKSPPFVMAEFSRGCVFKCDFCASRNTMALGLRKKSPERCAAEVKKLRDLGYREFGLADDIFTSDQKWAVAVCDKIVESGVKMDWTCINGIRVESADDRLFEALAAAGCYRVSFGFESGNDEVLRLFGKGGKASVEQGKRAVKMAARAGIDTNGYFMLGLSPDTEETMAETIEFARHLPLDMLKFGFAIAFPGTPMFHDYVAKGLIKTFDWDQYFMYTDQELFTHPTLSHEAMHETMEKAYRRAILFNPGFIVRRLWHGLRTGGFFWDLYYAAKFYLMPSTGAVTQSAYYARERWPVYDFQNNPPAMRPYPVVRRQSGTAS